MDRIIFKDGSSLLYDDGKKKSFKELLENLGVVLGLDYLGLMGYLLQLLGNKGVVKLKMMIYDR